MANNDTPAEDKPRTVTAKLRCLDHRGETITTRWGDVTFDREGLAELEVPEGELQMLREIRPFSWLAEDHGPPAAPPVPDEATPPDTGAQTDGTADGKKQQAGDGKKGDKKR